MFFCLMLMYMEGILKVSVFRNLFDLGFVYMVLFSIPVGGVMYFLSTLLGETANRRIALALIATATVIYGAQLIYYKVFSTFLSVYSFIGAGQAMQFYNTIGRVMLYNIVELVLFILPFCFFLLLGKRYLPVLQADAEFRLRVAVMAAAVQFLAVSAVKLSKYGDLSPAYLYSDTFIIDASVNKFGVLTTMRLDIKHLLGGSPAASLAEDDELGDDEKKFEHIDEDSSEKGKRSADYAAYSNSTNEGGFNVMNIDFESLIADEEDEELKEMHEYFMNVEPTAKNDHTGRFRGKNLILITAEGFSPYAVDEVLTPTLYKMMTEGYQFSNFYTPIWGVSTSDGEYTTCMGLIPKAGIWSMYRSGENLVPFCLGNQLRRLGYETHAYHNHYFDYYRREISHPNMGYEYKALGNGLDVTETWPESDLEMIDLTANEYINDAPFHTYYMTVSGHLEYSFGGNAMSQKNKDYVNDLEYSNAVKAYLACNIELDRAMESLIAKLEEAGIAENTVIAISPDHYPYGLTVEEISELAGHEVERAFELYKSILIVWHQGIEAETVNKPCSSLDILPTLSNLMGIEYDSRLLMGKDIFSEGEPLVVFSNRSWMTNRARYDSSTGEMMPVDEGDEPDEEYKKQISAMVARKFGYSAMVLDKNYYEHVFK